MGTVLDYKKLVAEYVVEQTYRGSPLAVKQGARRSFAMFWASLTEAQRYEYANERRITVVAKSGTTYHLYCRGCVGNVYVVDASKPHYHTRRYCCIPQAPMFTAHALLIQKLALEHDEGYFLTRAARQD